MRTMKHTYRVEVAFLNTESDDINVEYVECIEYIMQDIQAITLLTIYQNFRL